MKRYAVYLSPLATLKLDLLFDHLEGEWGSKAKHSFRDKLNKTIQRLSEHPKSSSESRKMKGIYRSIVTPQTSLYYRIISEEIEIITIIDNRQHPRKVKEEINKYFGDL